MNPGTRTPGSRSCMNRAAFALRSGTTPTTTFARSNSPRARIRSAHAFSASTSYAICVMTTSAPASSLSSSRFGSYGSASGMSATAIRYRGGSAISAPDNVVPSSRIRFASPTMSSTDRSFTTVASGWSPIFNGSPVRQRRLRAPNAHAPSRSAVMPSRFRSRHVSCTVGSTPAADTNRTPASGDMCALAVGLSVTLAASTYPTSARA